MIEAGRQAALMAPTEILARQHLATIAPLAEAAGIRVAILTGRERGPARKRSSIASAWRDRSADRHPRTIPGGRGLSRSRAWPSWTSSTASACISDCARAEGRTVDVLVMTATPIPRTLVLTYFGDMDISELREKPPGRQPIDTRTIPLSRARRGRGSRWPRARSGKRAYWVCPLVDESERSRSRRRAGAL